MHATYIHVSERRQTDFYLFFKSFERSDELSAAHPPASPVHYAPHLSVLIRKPVRMYPSICFYVCLDICRSLYPPPPAAATKKIYVVCKVYRYPSSTLLQARVLEKF
jgi:hypothetical protein